MYPRPTAAILRSGLGRSVPSSKSRTELLLDFQLHVDDDREAVGHGSLWRKGGNDRAEEGKGQSTQLSFDAFILTVSPASMSWL